MKSPTCSRPTSRDGTRSPKFSPPQTPRSPPLKSALKHHGSSSSASALMTGSPVTSPSPPILSPPASIPMTRDGSESKGPGITFARETLGDPLPEVSQLSLDASSSHDHTTGSSSALSSPRTSMSSSRRPNLHRRTSSDVPPGYERRVGFSTLEAEEGTSGGGIGAEFSFTAQAKSEGYAATGESRCFLVASDGASYSISAIDWLVSTLVEDGDEVVVLRVIEPGSAAHKEFAADMEAATKLEAEEVLMYVLNKNDRKITVSVEFVIGSILKTISRILEVYRPDSLVVGTRGRTESAWKKAFLGSTSQYLVAKSPVPVIVVRPERKVRKSVQARNRDPKRRSYQALLSPTMSREGSLDRNRRSSTELKRKSNKDLRREKTSPA